MESQVKVTKGYLFILNQIFEIQQKAERITDPNSISRNVNKLVDYFEYELLPENNGLVIHDPFGEKFDETRTDVEASIAGNSTEKLVIAEVIKPIIRLKQGNFSTIIQKGVVVVKSKDEL